MSLGLYSDYTVGATDGTLISAANPLVFTSTNASFDVGARWLTVDYEADIDFTLPSRMEVKVGATWYSSAEPLTTIGDTNEVVKFKQTSLSATAPSVIYTTSSNVTAASTDHPFGYPRIAIWWPTSPIAPATASKYDLVLMDNRPSEFSGGPAAFVSQTKALNPNCIMTVGGGSIDCQDIIINVTTYDHSNNVRARTLSLDWVLTQVGTVLTASANASQTTFAVADSSVFQVGVPVLIGGTPSEPYGDANSELCVVSATNSTSFSVTSRGTDGSITPAYTHASGTRAACVVWWHTVEEPMMDMRLTTARTRECPTADIGYGDERWIDANVRQAEARRALWGADGSNWDRADNVIAVPGRVSTVDLYRDNTDVEDYTDFEDDMGDGLLEILHVIHDTIPGVNNANRPQGGVGQGFEWINGDIKEHRPHSTWTTGENEWYYSFVAGGEDEYNSMREPLEASYFEWCDQALQPPMSVVQVDIETAWSTAQKRSMMRWAVTSALLRGGFVAIEENIHGTYTWCDEYSVDEDGNATGDDTHTHYLGWPVADAYELPSSGPTTPYASTTGVWWREFDNGVAICNPNNSGTSATVYVDQTYTRIYRYYDYTGTPNDGTTVTASLSVAGHDGIILLK